MDKLETIHAVTVGNRCFGQIYNNLEVQELLELEFHEVDSSVPRTTEKLLLKLTTIHRLFQLLLSGRKTCGKLNDVCHFVLSNNIFMKLVSCLEDTNHHVVFMASKAISSLMLSVPLISATKIQLEGLFQNSNGSEWKPLYVMDILKHVIESRAGGKAVHNVRIQPKTSSICNCLSNEPRIFTNEEKNRIELRDFILAQDWMTILPLYVPLWKEIFVRCFDVVTENPNYTTVDLLEYHSKLTSSTHQRIVDGCFDISAKSEQMFVSFLSFTAEFFKWTLSSCYNVENLESHEEMLLLKIIQVMPHFLHVRELSSDVWKEILKVLSFTLNTSTFTQGSKHCQSQTSTSKSILHSATTFVYAVNCGILDNLPVDIGFEGFGGSTIKPVKENLVESCKTRVPNTGLFRQASLLVVQAALVLLNSCDNYRNAQLSQDIFKAINIWYSGMIKVGTSDHDNEEPYQKGSSSHDYQEAYHRKPSMILMDVFADQDDEMIQIMLLLLQLFKVSREAVNQDTAAILSTLNPHLIFQAFLKVVGFDHSVLLDFLISSETVFLEYLMQYLHFVLQDWQGFFQSNNNLVEDAITTDEDEIETRSSSINYQQSYHSNVRTILKPPENKPLSLPIGIMACSQASSGDIASTSVGLGGLLNICSAYGSDVEDDDDDDDENILRESNSDGLENAEDVGIHDTDVQKSLSSYDNADHTCMYSGGKVERKHAFGTDNMGSSCDDNSHQDNEGEDFSVYNSTWKNEKNQDDNDGNDIDMAFANIDDMKHGDDDDDTQKTFFGHELVTDDHTDVYDNEEDINADDDDKMNSTSSIHFQSATDSLPTILEETMSTLIHTRIAAERLNDGSLFPYQVKPLINVMKKVENLYDGC